MREIARWNPARDVWEVPETENLLCEHLDVFSETWPNSGMTCGGTAYALPTWEHRTDASVSSSSQLLPTPTVQDGANTGGPSQFDRNTLPLNAQVLRLT